MNRKAQWGDIQRLILISIAGILLLTFVGVKVYQTYFTKTNIETCRFSALAQAETKIIGNSPIDLNCGRRFVQINNDYAAMEYNPDPKKIMDITVNGKKMGKYPALTDDTVNSIIAEEMRVCWYQFGEGKIDVFQDKIFAGQNACFICSEIKFDGKISTTKFTGLIDYLQNTAYPSGAESYFNYFAETKNLKNWTEYINKDKEMYDPILTKNIYYVLFEKDTTFFTFKTGTSKNSYLVLLVPFDQLNNKCSYIAG